MNEASTKLRHIISKRFTQDYDYTFVIKSSVNNFKMKQNLIVFQNDFFKFQNSIKLLDKYFTIFNLT